MIYNPQDWIYNHYPWNMDCKCTNCVEEKERVRLHDEWRREYDRLYLNKGTSNNHGK